MTKRPEIFAREWRSSLRAHYQRVIQQGETQNERSLLRVLTQLNFSETELSELRAAAISGAPVEIAQPIPNQAEIRAKTRAGGTLAASIPDCQPGNSTAHDEMAEIDTAAEDANELDNDPTLQDEAVDDTSESPQLTLFD